METTISIAAWGTYFGEVSAERAQEIANAVQKVLGSKTAAPKVRVTFPVTITVDGDYF